MQTLGRLETMISYSLKKSNLFNNKLQPIIIIYDVQYSSFTVLQYWNFKTKELRKETCQSNQRDQVNYRCSQDLETNDDKENTHENIKAIKKERKIEKHDGTLRTNLYYK